MTVVPQSWNFAEETDGLGQVVVTQDERKGRAPLGDTTWIAQLVYKSVM